MTREFQASVGGMNCSFCVQSLEQAFRSFDAVDTVEVSLAHEEILVRYEDERLDEQALRETLRELGYTIRDPDKEQQYEQRAEELRVAKQRLLLSGAASFLVFTGMVYMILWWGMLSSMYRWLDIATGVLAVLTMFGPGWYIMKKAYYSAKRGIFNQHVLLEGGAFAGLLGGLLGVTVYPSFPAMHFFGVSTFLTTYHILSGYASLLVRNKASEAVRGLLEMQPDTARIVTDEGAEEVPIGDVDIDDTVLVKPGERVPVDGEVVDGASAVDESVATGESLPVDKGEGDNVIGGSMNQTGRLHVAVEATGDDAFLHSVAKQIEEARAMKPGVVQLADKVLTYFVPGVFIAAAWALTAWMIGPLMLGAQPGFERGLFAALAVLVLGYPCALGMATPLALIRGGGEAAQRGVLMRSGDAFQVLPDIDVVVFDKTGTLTEGEPYVQDIATVPGGNERDMVSLAATAEKFSEHPLGNAITTFASDRGIAFTDPDGFESISGKGVIAHLDGKELRVGKLTWLTESADLSEHLREMINQCQDQGLTTIGVKADDTVLGVIAVGDRVKQGCEEVVSGLAERGIQSVMLTGDTEATAQAVASKTGIGEVKANMLPHDKISVLQTYQERGNRVAMVGDGINDAPALTQADIGIAIGAGTDIAIESADVILTDDELSGVIDAYEIGKESYKQTKQNLFVAFSFNGFGVPAAMTGLVHPVFAMIAMIASVSLVLANSFAGQIVRDGRLNTSFKRE